MHDGIPLADTISLVQIDLIAEAIRTRLPAKPRIAVILGSGLGALADEVEHPVRIPYGEIPSWPVSTVMGHQGRLVSGRLEGQDVIVMQGRVHYYEGYSMAQVTLPVRVMQRLGVQILVVTNAAGGIPPDFQPGDLMLIQDHINLIGISGLSPLRGPNLDELGPRFPDMGQAYDRELFSMAKKAALQAGIAVHEGVYVCLAGPSFETPADLRFLRLIGADAVGMSTVPEVSVARHGGTRVLGISGISNKANLDGNLITSHEEVMEAGQKIVPKLIAIVRGIFRQL
jgi:purine-nucleoside phosphorylase